VPPSIRSTSTAASDIASSLTFDKPTGAAVGDTMVVFVHGVSFGVNTQPTTLTGWTQEATGNVVSGTDYSWIEVWSKDVDGTEGANFTVSFTGGTSTYPFANCFCVQDTAGVDTASSYSPPDYTLTRQLPGLTTSQDNELLLAGYGLLYVTVPTTSPSGWTPNNGRTFLWTFTKDAATAGAVSTTSFDDPADYELPPAVTIAMLPVANTPIHVLGRYTPGTVQSSNVRR
jgi:hypothetical protein